MAQKKFCEECGDPFCTSGDVCADCLREAEIKDEADRWQRQFRLDQNNEALQQMEFIVTKCALCDQYYGPYSMEKHLQEDHSLDINTQELAQARKEGYDEGYDDGVKAMDTSEF